MQPSTTTTMTGPATVAALVALALAAAAVTRASAQSPDFSTGALNEPWVLDEICRFGELPGTLVKGFPLHGISGGWGETTEPNPYWPGHRYLYFADDWATADFGGRYQLLDRKCQLQNLIKPILDYSAPKPPAESFKLVILSDSLDTHLVEWIGEHHLRKFGGESEQWKALGYRNYLHDRGPQLNFATSTSGLSLFHMFLLTLDSGGHLKDAGDVHHFDTQVRVNNTRTQFDWRMAEATGIPTQNRTFQPDVIVVHCNYWTLYDHYWHKLRTDNAEFLLSYDYLQGFIKNLTRTAREVRAVFPEGLLVMRTTPMVRHDPVTGGVHAGGRNWAHRMHVAQLNEGIRLVAKELGMPLIDVERITDGLTPAQSLYDDIHINDALAWEVVNVYMNYGAAYKAELEKRAGRRRRGRALR